MTARLGWMPGLTIAAVALSLSACASTSGDGDAASGSVALADNGSVVTPAHAAVAPSGGAGATLTTAAGQAVGTVTASATRGGVTFTVDGRMLPAGVHGIHVHGVGQCEGPKFASAGGHWNPTGRMHGKDNPAGPHQGDLPNLTIDAGGTGTLTYTVPGATLAGLLDADGAAFIIHANADDYRTDPAGASGDRIACGVFSAA